MFCLDQYNRSIDLKDLEAAIENIQAGTTQTPESHPDLAARLQLLAELFRDKYHRFDDLKDLDAAHESNKAAVAHTPDDHPALAERLLNLGISFTDRYCNSGDVKDLEASLRNNQTALAKLSHGHPDRTTYLLSLAMSLTHRYRRSGDMKDLEAALQNYQTAVAQTPVGHPQHALCLQSLATSLTARYLRWGDLTDLKAALEMNQAAVNHTPATDPNVSLYLHSLAQSFMHQYTRSGGLKDLDAAVRNHEAAVAQTPAGHLSLAERLQALGDSLMHRYLQLGQVRDLEAAVKYTKKCVALTPPAHLDFAARLQTFALALTGQYERSSNLEDLEAALKNDQAAVAHTQRGHLNLAQRLQNLAVSFADRYEVSGAPEDLDAALVNYSASFQGPTADLEKSWESAIQWASLAKTNHPSQMLEAYSAAFNLLPELLWIGNLISVRQDRNRRINVSQATSNAVCVSIELHNLPLAVEFYEQGVGTTFRQLLELKSNLVQLPHHYAAELNQMSQQLYNGTARDPSKLARERNDLLEKIRKTPGLEHYLQPRPYIELCQASQHGPIVILNSHVDHCDSIILLNPNSDPLHIALPSVSVDRLKVQKSLLRDLIKGRNVRSRELPPARLYGYQEGIEVGLDLHFLLVLSDVLFICLQNGITSGRLWWCPMGDFTGLPFHAVDSADQFIQSYTPTLGALLEANSKTLSTNLPCIGLVGVTHTGPRRDQELPGVEEEITKITSIAGDRYQVQSLIGESTTVDSVKQTLNNCAWIHLACHGEQNIIEPPKSCLQLYGGTLELETILQMSLPNAEFVFLAACQTAKGDAALVNESFHLGGGFIAAGFQGVIATMWSMMDEDGPAVAETVYSHLLGSGKRPRASEAAKALQLAVQKMRDARVPHEQWVPFIHLGI
ncbi:CHAT domain-containing protein [Mycena rebaudengoi]|nr:CHAT domain-containing protein [Mycena rebaudengoi]